MKTSKRFLALVLSACMAFAVFATVPGINNAQAFIEDDGDILFNFGAPAKFPADLQAGTNESFGTAKAFAYIAEGNGSDVTTLSAMAQLMTFDNTQSASKKRSPWQIESALASVMAYTEGADDPYSKSGTWARLYNTYGLSFHVYKSSIYAGRKANTVVTLRVSDGEAGWYKIEPKYFIKTNDGSTSVFNLSLADANGNAVGNALSIEGTTASWATGDMGVYYFTPGDYTFTAELADVVKAEGKNHLACVQSVTLKPVANPYSIGVTSIDENLQDKTLTEGETANVSIALFNGSEAVEGVEFTVDTTNPLVATAAIEGDVVTITAVGEGSATISASAVIAGATITIDVPISVEAIVVEEKDPHDINGDGKVNTRDVVALRRYIADN